VAGDFEVQAWTTTASKRDYGAPTVCCLATRSSPSQPAGDSHAPDQNGTHTQQNACWRVSVSTPAGT